MSNNMEETLKNLENYMEGEYDQYIESSNVENIKQENGGKTKYLVYDVNIKFKNQITIEELRDFREKVNEKITIIKCNMDLDKNEKDQIELVLKLNLHRNIISTINDILGEHQ